MPESTNPVVVPDNETQEELQDVLQEVNELDKEVRPESQASNLCCSTDENVTTFLSGQSPSFHPPKLPYSILFLRKIFMKLSRILSLNL